MSNLHSAAYDGHPGWVQTCLARGDVVDERDNKGYTPLLWSCFRGLVGNQVPTAALLIGAGANVNAVVLPRGESCLQLACQSSNRKLVELLLNNGADPNLVADELSPLMFAIRCHDEETARVLLERGADVSYQLHKRTAADYAEYEGFTELATVIRDAVSPRKEGNHMMPNE